MVKRKSYSIGIVVPELITNLFFQFIIIAQKAASLGGYEVVICHSNESFSNEMEVLKRLFAYQVDGIILSLSMPYSLLLKQSQKEYVLVLTWEL